MLAASLPADAAAATGRNVIDTGPTGFDPADSIRIETTGVGCPTARSLANKAGRIAVQAPVRLRGFTCRHDGLRRDGTFSQRCRRGSRRVTWVPGSAERRCPGTSGSRLPLAALERPEAAARMARASLKL